ncbi:MAG: glycosyltransferase family 39 protein [Phycisphaerae bacterium]
MTDPAGVAPREPLPAGEGAALAAGERPVRHEKLWLALIVLLALAIRLVAAWMHGVHVDRDGPSFVYPAMSLLRGDLADWFYLQTKPPVFGAIVAVPMALGMEGLAAVRLLSILFGVAMLHPAWLFFRRFGGRRTALLALLVLAMMRLPVKTSGRTLSDTFYATLTLYMFYLAVVKGLIDRRWWGLAGGGLLAGVAFLTRSEAIIFLPVVPLLALYGALRRRIDWKLAAVSLSFPLLAAAVMAPQVALLSRAEGRFTLRRNVGQFMAYSAGATDQITSEQGEQLNAAEALVQNFGALALNAVGHFWKYVYDVIPRGMAYVGAVFVLVGLWSARRKVFAWTPLGLSLLTFLWALGVLSIFDPHGRLLLNTMPFLAWPLVVGIAAIAGWIVKWNPAGIAQPDKAGPWIAAALIATVTVPTVPTVLGRDRHEGYDALHASRIIRRHAGEDARPVVACRLGVIALRAGADLVGVSHEWDMDVRRLGEYLRRHNADYFCMSAANLRTMLPGFEPGAPPAYLELIGTAPSHPGAQEPRTQYVYRVRH